MLLLSSVFTIQIRESRERERSWLLCLLCNVIKAAPTQFLPCVFQISHMLAAPFLADTAAIFGRVPQLNCSSLLSFFFFSSIFLFITVNSLCVQLLLLLLLHSFCCLCYRIYNTIRILIIITWGGKYRWFICWGYTWRAWISPLEPERWQGGVGHCRTSNCS